MTGEVAEDDPLGADVDERRVEVGDVGAGAEELLRGLLQALALEHAHLDAEFGPVVGGPGRGDEVVESVVVDVGGEAVEGRAHPEEDLDRPRPVVEVAAGVELRLGEHGFDGGDEVGQSATEAFGTVRAASASSTDLRSAPNQTVSSTSRVKAPSPASSPSLPRSACRRSSLASRMSSPKRTPVCGESSPEVSSARCCMVS